MQNQRHLGLLSLPWISLLIFTACDPLYTVDYEVHNDTPASIQVITSYPELGFTDTNVIGTGTQLVFFDDSGLGQTTDDYLDRLTAIPMELKIMNREGIEYKKDENDIQWWKRVYPDKKEGIGRVYLRIRAEDFK